MAYKILRTVAGALLCLLFRVEVRQAGNIPVAGGVIVCANHLHMFDPILMVLGTRRQIQFMAKDKVFTWPLIGYLARLAGAFPVRRGHADIAAVKHSLRLLSDGRALGIFPEGTRGKAGEARAPFQGVTMLAERTDCPIVPAAIVGDYKFRRPLAIIFGPPVSVRSLCPAGQYDRTEATRRLMGIIEDLKEKLQ